MIVAALFLASAMPVNLYCAGLNTVRQPDKPENQTPWVGSIQIDLSAGIYCVNSCSQKRPIKDSTRALIILANNKMDGITDYEQIDRETGELDISMVAGEINTTILAQCRVVKPKLPSGRLF